MTKQEQAAKLANELLNFVNDFTSDKQTFVEVICNDHRTLQQSVMRLFVLLSKRMSQNNTDERNRDAVNLAKEIAEIANNHPLPMI